MELWSEHKAIILDALRIGCVQLRAREDAISLLFYHPALLEGRMQELCGHSLLCKRGYPKGGTVCAVLHRLCQRFAEESVPHEIGLFLGYPERDVEAFVQGRQDHCFCRHWKVYHDPAEAEKIMARIDRARRLAAELLDRYEACRAAEALHRNIA